MVGYATSRAVGIVCDSLLVNYNEAISIEAGRGYGVLKCRVGVSVPVAAE